MMFVVWGGDDDVDNDDFHNNDYLDDDKNYNGFNEVYDKNNLIEIEQFFGDDYYFEEEKKVVFNALK